MTAFAHSNRDELSRFVEESWKIERLYLNKEDLNKLTVYHKNWLKNKEMKTSLLIDAASTFTKGYGKLRNKVGMNVIVGNHEPLPGGHLVEEELEQLCEYYNKPIKFPITKCLTPYGLHRRFETLHPFLDGNGRTGRLLWAWLMNKWQLPWERIGFLHTWYYQSLDEI